MGKSNKTKSGVTAPNEPATELEQLDSTDASLGAQDVTQDTNGAKEPVDATRQAVVEITDKVLEPIGDGSERQWRQDWRRRITPTELTVLKNVYEQVLGNRWTTSCASCATRQVNEIMAFYGIR